MPASPAAPVVPPRNGEAVMSQEAARTALLADVRTGRTGIAPEVIVDLALRASAGAHHGVAQAAVAALQARLAQVTSEELRVAEKVAWGPGVVAYRLRRRRAKPRPYSVLVTTFDPLVLSCDCDDYLKNGLGACKHGFAVVAARSKARRTARVPAVAPGIARLSWDPGRSLTGPGPWLEGLRYRPADGTDPLGDRLRRAAAPRGGWWDAPAASDGPLAPAAWVLDDDGARTRFLDAIGAAVDATQRQAPRRRRLVVDPALVALLRSEREARKLRKTAADAMPAAERALASLKLRLYRYQRDGVRRFLSQGRLLLADDMGLGKTAQAVAACHALVRSGAIGRALVVVPASLRAQWMQEWRHFTDVPLVPVEGDAAGRAALYRTRRRGVLLTHYEQLLRDEPSAAAFAPDLLVLDEAQRIKNWATRTAACVKRLPARFRLVLTGTPFENRLEELASLLDLVDERALQPLWRLQAWHVDAPVTGARAGIRGLDVLRTRIAGSVLRRSRAEVLGQLPARTDTRIPVELTDEQRVAHDDLSPSIARLAATAGRRPLTREEFLRLMSLLTTQRIIANGMAQLEFAERWPALERSSRPDAASLRGLGSPKLLELRELVRQIVVEQGRKMVVFSQWRRMLQLAGWALRDVLDDAGLRAVAFTGAESLARRSRSVVEFHDDPSVRVLFATDAGGVGLNLQRAATCAVHLELPWNPAVLEQRAARIHRLGQTRPVDVYALVAADCIEERIAGIVGNKRALFQGLFEGTSDEVRFERAESFVSRVAQVAGPPPSGGAERETGFEADAAAEARADEVVAATSDETSVPAPQAQADDPSRPGAAAPGGFDIRRTGDGRIEIRAAPADAARLLALLQGLVDSLKPMVADGTR